MENFKQIYDRYMKQANGDPLRAALDLATRLHVLHDNADEAQEALKGLIREALVQRNAKVGARLSGAAGSDEADERRGGDQLGKLFHDLVAQEVATNYYAFKELGHDCYEVGSFPTLEYDGILWRTPHFMPPWWSPSQRFWVRRKADGFTPDAGSSDYNNARHLTEGGYERITADLETGEEVSA